MTVSPTRPTAAPAVWPYPGHRNMAQVMADETRPERVRCKSCGTMRLWRCDYSLYPIAKAAA